MSTKVDFPTWLLEHGPSRVWGATPQRQPGWTPWFSMPEAWSLSSFGCEVTMTFQSRTDRSGQPGQPGQPGQHCGASAASAASPDRTFHLARGSLLLLPPHSRRRFYVHTTGVHRTIHFGLPPDHPPASSNHPPAIAAHVNTAPINQIIDAILASPQQAARRAQAWALSWQLHEGAVDGPPQQADPVSKARHFIVRHLAEPISIPEVAAASGLSHNQLLRRFRAATGCTLLAWLRRTRCERALDLLQHSDLSIAAIGAAVGYPDPQHFNKIMRTETNKPPRAWRQHFLASAQPP